MPQSGGYFLLITKKTLHWQRACLQSKSSLFEQVTTRRSITLLLPLQLGDQTKILQSVTLH
jgi:hypothetical protein